MVGKSVETIEENNVSLLKRHQSHSIMKLDPKGRENLRRRTASFSNINIQSLLASVASPLSGRRIGYIGGSVDSGGSLSSAHSIIPSSSSRDTTKISLSDRGSGGGSVLSGSGSGGSSGGSIDESASHVRRKRRRGKKSRKDGYCWTFFEYFAQFDVFLERESQPPYLTCIRLGLIAIPIFLTILIWDTLAVTVFEVPDLSLIDHPIFAMAFQFITLLLSMYGFAIHFVRFGHDKVSFIARMSLVCHYIMFVWRAFMEIYFDGFRFQEKLYLPVVGMLAQNRLQ